jgi:hypothetical protein
LRDQADDSFDVESVDGSTRGDGLLAAFEDLALDVHLHETPLGVASRGRHDDDVSTRWPERVFTLKPYRFIACLPQGWEMAPLAELRTGPSPGD